MPITRPEYVAACPDCPGARLGVLRSVVGKRAGACGFATSVVEARAPLPDWSGYDLAWLRRGVVIRERASADGRSTAIDAAGPGCVFPIDEAVSGYAAVDSIVCLLARPRLEKAFGNGEGLEVMTLHRAALERLERLAHARGASTVRAKVALLLVALAETLSPPRIRMDLPEGLQQRDLARLLSIRHESVCRCMAELEREGLVVRGPLASIDRLDLPRLRAVA